MECRPVAIWMPDACHPDIGSGRSTLAPDRSVAEGEPVATRAPDSPHGAVAVGSAVPVGQWSATRLPYLDNLKVIIVAAIIAIHGVLGYVGLDQYWSYADVQEVTLSPVTEIALSVPVVPFALFMIALLFLVAGLLTGPSLRRKGPGRFARDRLLRLGVPFVVVVLVLWPLLMYALYHPLGAAPGSYWAEFLGAEGNLDTGPLWFVGVLLIFSLGYAAAVHLRRRPPRRAVGELTMRHLVLLAALVATLSFLVRLVFPFASESFTDLNLWEWPACLALFALGIAASRRGWLTAIPHRLRTRCRAATLVAAGAMAALVAGAALLDTFDAMLGGWTWWALAFAAVESTLNVCGSVWLLAVAQRHLDRQVRWTPVLSRSAYGAFMVQGPVLIALAVALRPVPVPAEVKALIVAAGGVAGSFALARLLISRVPRVARVL
jgi:hypothetical protein